MSARAIFFFNWIKHSTHHPSFPIRYDKRIANGCHGNFIQTLFAQTLGIILAIIIKLKYKTETDLQPTICPFKIHFTFPRSSVYIGESPV